MNITMKRFLLLTVFIMIMHLYSAAQCSICTKTASQLGKGPAEGMNTGIIYLMLAPLALGGFIGYQWWKRERLQ